MSKRVNETKRRRERTPETPERSRPSDGARVVALDALLRIEDGAYAHVVVPAMLGQSSLSDRDRAFATQLVYGTVRAQPVGTNRDSSNRCRAVRLNRIVIRLCRLALFIVQE